jgi:hypothetical protein
MGVARHTAHPNGQQHREHEGLAAVVPTISSSHSGRIRFWSVRLAGREKCGAKPVWDDPAEGDRLDFPFAAAKDRRTVDGPASFSTRCWALLYSD